MSYILKLNSALVPKSLLTNDLVTFVFVFTLQIWYVFGLKYFNIIKTKIYINKLLMIKLLTIILKIR